MKKVIYTSIVGGYDPLLQPDAVDESFDYICFSNDFNAERIGVWQIHKIPFGSDDRTICSRYVKILPHKVLGSYDVSIWVDANIRIKSDEFYKIVDSVIEKGSLVAQVQHPDRDCVYDDVTECYAYGKISFHDLIKERRMLMGTGFPVHYGLYENNLILRFHNDPKVVSLSEDWWNSYREFGKRDQFSLVPVYWKSGFRPALLLGEGKNTRNVPYLEYNYHKVNRTKLQILKRRFHSIWSRIIIKIFRLSDEK